MDLFPDSFHFYRLDYRPAERVLPFGRSWKDLAKIESKFRPDVVFTTSGPSYWRPRAPHLMGFNLPHHVYQDSPYFSQVLGLVQRFRWRAKSMLIRYYTREFADAWVVQTDDVNSRLRKWIRKSNVYTVPNTIGRAYAQRKRRPGTEQKTTSGDTEIFRLLVLSSYYPHKNLELIDDVINLLRERRISNVRFVMTLPEHSLERVISAKNVDWIENVGPQRPDDCPALYTQTNALFLPSLLECFSANFVEAMAMKRPIITTDLGFARSICAGAALYFEPLNACDAMNTILELRKNSDLYQELVKQGQIELQRYGSAGERANAYLSLCKELVEYQCTQQE